MNLAIRMRIIYNAKTSLCNLFEIWRQIPNFSNQVSAWSKSQYLLCDKKAPTFILPPVFGIFYGTHILTCFYNKVCITEKYRL